MNAAATARYGDLFESVLRELIAGGGDPWAVITLVRIHERLDLAGRAWAFTDWADAHVFACSRCAAVLTVTSDEIAEDDPILCAGCAAQ